MARGQSPAQKYRFYSTVVGMYLLTAFVGWYIIQPTGLVSRTSALVVPKVAQTPQVPHATHGHLVYGRPVRIVIPNSGVDLPVDPGYYDSATGQWTLSGYRAQFAMISTLANNITGDTFIYGHNNNYVFGALRHHTPVVGAPALIYTDNGHILQYTFQKSSSLAPEDTSVFSYSGPPIMTIQTCTGSLNEWRTMYQYGFEKVVQ